MAVRLLLFPWSADRLCDKSLGHVLPALAVLFSLGYAPDSIAVDATVSFFKNYLAARQLHDDAHDWKDDLMHGRINAATTQLIRIFYKKHPEAPRPFSLSRDSSRNFRGYFGAKPSRISWRISFSFWIRRDTSLQGLRFSGTPVRCFIYWNGWRLRRARRSTSRWPSSHF